MTKKIFLEQVTEQIRGEISGDFDVTCDVFVKNNDTSRYGVVIQKRGETVSPTIYVDEYYQDYIRKKLTIPEISGQIIALLDNVREHAARYHSITLDLDSCRDSIVYRLISREKNKRLLRDIPYLPFLDLAITFYVVCGISEQGLESLRISNELMERWDISVSELVRLAEKNTPRLFPLKTETMADVLLEYFNLDEELLSDEEENEEAVMIILTNTAGINGASVLLYPDAIHGLAERLQKNLYVLPSSIHEIIVVPDEGDRKLGDLKEMVMGINKNHVRDDEVLSDNAYYYDREQKRFLY